MDPVAPPPGLPLPLITDDSMMAVRNNCGGNACAISAAINDDDLSSVAARGSIAERRAAKCGFNAARINTARFRTMSPSASPSASVRSPCLTIPSGISPTALLDSPILLPNSQLSPTTGTFLLPMLNYESSVLNIMSPRDNDKNSNAGSSFRFETGQNPNSFPGFIGLDDQGADGDNQVPVQVETDIDFEFPLEFSKEAISKSCAMDTIASAEGLNSMVLNADCGDLQKCCSDVAGDQFPQRKEPIHGEDTGIHPPDGEQKGAQPSMVMLKTSEDGYNWRKYGQKQVKGSEYPRSYYKCTHPNCHVKKKVERSHDGQITEIIYKGAHNHPKLQPCRRASVGPACSSDEMTEVDGGNGSCVKVDGGAAWRNNRLGSMDHKLGSNWRADGMERTSSASVVTELSDPFSITQGKSVGIIESSENLELSSTLASHGGDDDDDDGATQGSISLGVDTNEDEPESKRRKTDNCFFETSMGSRAVREPRVVVQIESDVDILDDGYRWRKYGQKVVKGNPNPRSYYKCTSAGCSVRKHVERSSHNLKCVITTYEGKHNHAVPAARNSSHVNSNGGSLPPTVSAQSTLTLPRNTNATKTETHTKDVASCFDRKHEFNNQYLRPTFLGNISTEMKFGASSIYQMKFPSLQNNMSYASYGLNCNRSVTNQAGSIASIVPDFPMSLPLNLPASENLSLAGFDCNNSGRAIGPVPSFLQGQQFKDNDMRFIRPKQEQKDDNIYGTGVSGVPVVDHANVSSSSVYHSVMGNYPS